MDKFLPVSKIFLSGAVIGLLNGIGIMYLLNGILGHAGIKEAIMAFISFELVSIVALAMVFKRLKNIWNISIHYPIPKPEK